jgi:hypothetical protein
MPAVQFGQQQTAIKMDIGEGGSKENQSGVPKIGAPMTSGDLLADASLNSWKIPTRLRQTDYRTLLWLL